MSILHKLIAIIVFASVLISGCRMLSPSDQPFLPGEYLHQAEMAGAAEFAPEEYQRLLLEFYQLEKLHQTHQYDAVNKRLPTFTADVERLVELTRQNISKAEAQATHTETIAPTESISPSPIVNTGPHETTNEKIIKPRSSYTVSEGELLWAIAKRPDVYGDPLLWPLLYQANRDQIKDPRRIYAGQSLTIPRNVSEEEREKARSLAKKSDFFSPE